MYIFIFLILLGLFAIKYWKPIKARLQRDSLGRETYEKLKNDFSARQIMEELNYIIEEIESYWQYIESIRVKSAETAIGKFAQFYMGKNESAEFHTTKKTLDDYIKKEWNPRLKILREYPESYNSNKELRNAFIQFNNADREIQKLTIEGAATQEFNKSLKVATIATVAITGLAIGAVGAANRFGDRQSIRDNLDI